MIESKIADIIKKKSHISFIKSKTEDSDFFDNKVECNLHKSMSFKAKKL